MTSDVKRESIARKNDQLRRTFTGGRVMLTSGVETSPNLKQIIDAVQQFSDFNESCDPYGEHDFGKVTINGEDYYFKIDYYDATYQFYEQDGNRVLTLMHSDEY